MHIIATNPRTGRDEAVLVVDVDPSATWTADGDHARPTSVGLALEEQRADVLLTPEQARALAAALLAAADDLDAGMQPAA